MGSLIPIYLFKYKFKRTNITSFIQLFENHIKGRVYNNKKKKILLTYFFHKDIRIKVEKACKYNTWEEVKVKLLKDFKKEDKK